MVIKRIGITGQNGFIGCHLYNTLALNPNIYTIIPFNKSFFSDQKLLEVFVSNCDVIIHLAAMNRNADQQFIFDTNISLVNKLILALDSTTSKAKIIFSSSTQEQLDNLYGRAKKKSRENLQSWARASNGNFVGLIIPNVFGPFCKPNYNSFIATFCHKLIVGESPEIIVDSEVELIYINELIDVIKNFIDEEIVPEEFHVIPSSKMKVSFILEKLNYFKSTYFIHGIFPSLNNSFEINLFNTFRSYINHKTFFPKKHTLHSDARGAFVEIAKLGIGGQVSFSTTFPEVTRGNHFHTRKIERFSVIQGKALIQMRNINSNEVLDFYLDGNEPAYVDIPLWFTHNIKNIGTEILYTNFWINEFFNPEDPDTYYVSV